MRISFEAYANRIMSLNNFTNQKVKEDSIKQISIKKYQHENAEYIKKSISWIE